MARKAKAVPETPFMNVKDSRPRHGLSECNLRKQLKEATSPHHVRPRLHQDQRPCPAAADGRRKVKGDPHEKT